LVPFLFSSSFSSFSFTFAADKRFRREPFVCAVLSFSCSPLPPSPPSCGFSLTRSHPHLLEHSLVAYRPARSFSSVTELQVWSIFGRMFPQLLKLRCSPFLHVWAGHLSQARVTFIDVFREGSIRRASSFASASPLLVFSRSLRASSLAVTARRSNPTARLHYYPVYFP